MKKVYEPVAIEEGVRVHNTYIIEELVFGCCNRYQIFVLFVFASVVTVIVLAATHKF